VNEKILTLMKQHQFTKCYGPRHLMSDLWRMNISKNKIPSYKQLQNKMFYFCHNFAIKLSSWWDQKLPKAQQFRLLSKSFQDADLIDDPGPRHQFIVDLQAWLESKVEEGYQLVLGIDANKAYHGSGGNFTSLSHRLDKPIPIKGHDGILATLFRTCGLVDPLLIQHPDSPPPATYDRGKDKIDFLFVSTSLLPHVT
jgi:hypothetical protein